MVNVTIYTTLTYYLNNNVNKLGVQQVMILYLS